MPQDDSYNSRPHRPTARHIRIVGGASGPLRSDIKILSRTVSRMDGQTLDRLWEAALRGDMVLAEQILTDHRVSGKKSKTPQWSETNSWNFGRVSKK